MTIEGGEDSHIHLARLPCQLLAISLIFQSDLLGSRTKACPGHTAGQHSRDPDSIRQTYPESPGDIVCLQGFGQVIVVLSSLSAIKDLLEKRGERYADRPTLPIQEMYLYIVVLRHPSCVPDTSKI